MLIFYTFALNLHWSRFTEFDFGLVKGGFCKKKVKYIMYMYVSFASKDAYGRM